MLGVICFDPNVFVGVFEFLLSNKHLFKDCYWKHVFSMAKICTIFQCLNKWALPLNGCEEKSIMMAVILV